MRSSNPALNENIFVGQAQDADFLRDRSTANMMTLNGTVLKTGILLLLTIASATLIWVKFWNPMMAGQDQLGATESSTPGWLIALIPFSGIIGALVGLVTVFVPRIAPFTAPIYAILQGVFMGTISCFVNARFPGIVAQAVLLTFGTFILMLLAYVTRLIQVTQKLRIGIMIATGGIALTYLATFLLSLFGIQVPYIHDSGAIGIAFSVFVVGIAAFNLLLDFDFVENSVRMGVPKYMEWYAGYALMVTLIWLYFEFLRLLMKLRGRD